MRFQIRKQETHIMNTAGRMESSGADFKLYGVSSNFTQGPPVTSFENFGDFENGTSSHKVKRIEICDVQLDADLFTSKLNQIDTSELEEIRLMNVSYSKKSNLVFLPALRNFFFKLKTFQDQVFEVTSTFFFKKIQNESWRRTDIGSLGVDITFQIEDILVLKIDHARKYLFVNLELEVAEEIMKKCTLPLEHLGLHGVSGASSEETLHLSIIPSNLKSLELYFEDNSNMTLNFLVENFANLEELIYKRSDDGSILIQKLPPKLKKLCLWGCTVSVDPEFSRLSEPLDVVTLYDCTLQGPLFELSAKHFNILERGEITLDCLDMILESSETNIIFVDSGAISQEVELNDSSVFVSALINDNDGLIQPDEAGKLKLPECGFLFWREKCESEQKCWSARREFLEERDFLIQKFTGVPLGYRCFSSDFEHELIGDESFLFCIPPRSLQRGTSYTMHHPLTTHPHLIKQLYLEKVQIDNSKPLFLAQLKLLEFITIKKCVCSSLDPSVAETWNSEVLPRMSDGFALSHLQRIEKLRGLTVIETRLESKYSTETGPLANVLDFLMIDGGSSQGGGEEDKIGKGFNIGKFNAKQVVIVGMTVSNAWMEGILKMPALELALIGNVNRCSNSRDVENFLEAAGLECWEPSFVLQKFSEAGTMHTKWKGKYIQRETEQYATAAAKFKRLTSEFNFFEKCKTFQNSDEYLHDRDSDTVAVDFRLPIDRQNSNSKESGETSSRDGRHDRAVEKFDPAKQSLEYKGIYEYKTGGYSVFDGFSESFWREPIKILKLEETVLLPNHLLRCLASINTQVLTELHLSQVIVNEELPQLDLPQLKVIDLSLSKTKFINNEVLKDGSNFAKFLSRFLPASSENPELSNLLSWKFDKISLQFDREQYFAVDHLQDKVYLAQLSFLTKVLDPQFKVRKLVLKSIGDFDLNKVNKTSLEILSIQDDGVCDWEEVEDGLQGMSNLVEFYFYRKPFGKKMQVRLDGIPSSVKYLGLSHVAFSASVPAQPLTLQHLVLLEVSLPPIIFASFPKYFNPKRLVVLVTNARHYGCSPTNVPNLDFVHAVTTSCETEWIYLSVFEETGSPEVESNMQAFLRKALVPKIVADDWNFGCQPLTLERRDGRWRNCEIERGNYYTLTSPGSVFENFAVGRNCDETIFRNKLVHFDGFGSEVTRVRSIDMSGVTVETDLLRSELKRVGTCAVESLSFQGVTFLGTQLEIGEIPFPNLEHFTMKDCSFGNSRNNSELCWDSVKTQLFFRKSLESGGEFLLRDLWTLGVHVSVKGIDVCPAEKKLFTKLDDGNSLVINAVGLERLTFISDSVKPVTFPVTLTYLSVETPMSWKELMTELADRQNLVEIHFSTNRYPYGMSTDIEIGQLPPNLKVLKIARAAVTFCADAEEEKTSPRPMDSLVFKYCTFPGPDFGTKCSQMFRLETVEFKKPVKKIENSSSL